MYKAILFDLDDTLFSLRGCEAEALQRTLEGAGLLSGLAADYADTYAAISAGYWAARTADGRSPFGREEIIERSWRDFLTRCELETEICAELAARFWKEFCRSSSLNPGARETLHQLSETYRLGVITNGYSDSQRGRLEAAGLLPLLEVVLVSEEVGAAKPDPLIFERALSLLDLRAEEVLYVGDSMAHDYQGCLAVGIDFCHYCPQPTLNMDLPPVAFRIKKLTALADLLPLQV